MGLTEQYLTDVGEMTFKRSVDVERRLKKMDQGYLKNHRDYVVNLIKHISTLI